MLLRLITFLWICGYTCLSYAQDPGMQLLSKDQIFHGRNPAMPLPKNYAIGLPEGSGRLYNEAGSLDDWWLTTADGKRSVSLQNIWQTLDRKQYRSEAGWVIRSLYFGKKFNRFQLGVYHTFQGDLDFKYPKDLVGLLGYGNYGFLQQEPLAKTQALDIRPEISITVYEAIGLEGGFFINDRLSVGAGVQYLAGLYNFTSDVKVLEVDIRDPLTLKANEDWTLHTADLVDQFSIDSLVLDTDRRALGTHPGIAFNAGVSYSVPAFQLGIQVRDLGSIQWKGISYSRKAATNYSGVLIDDFLDVNQNVFNQISDTLRAIANVTRSAQKYTSALTGKIILDGQYHISDHWSVGGSWYYNKNNVRSFWMLSGGIVFKPFPILQVGSQLSYDVHQSFNIGVMGALRLGFLNMYLSVDQVTALFQPASIDRLSARAGISILWGK